MDEKIIYTILVASRKIQSFGYDRNMEWEPYWLYFNESLKNDKEYLSDAPSASEVKDVPEQFKQWGRDNAERIEAARQRGSEPYFVKDNLKAINGIINPKSALEIAAVRHANRSPEQVSHIIQRFVEHEQRLYDADITNQKPSKGFKRILPKECNFTTKSNGYVITPQGRLLMANLNKQENEKFRKELRLAKTFAEEGDKMVFTSNDKSSHDVFINGKRADLKSTKSSNHVVHYAKHAVREQGAELVLFEFKLWNSTFIAEIEKLKRLGIHSKYVKPSDLLIYSF